MARFWKKLFAREAPQPRPRFNVVLPWPEDAKPAEPEAAPALGSADVQDWFYRLVLGMPGSEVSELRAPEQVMLKRLDELCGGDRFDITTLPRLPEVLPQLLRLLKSENSDGTKVAKLIGRDPVLVGEVMRVSRSAHYRTARPISSLQHAVVLLGYDGLRQMVAQHVMKPILQASAGMLGHAAGQRLWDHAERCAHACAYLAKGHGDPFEAYLAGVMCNAGVGAMIRLLDQEAPPTLGVFSRAFLNSYVSMSNHLTLRAARHWEMPPNVIEALRERLEVRSRPPTTELGNALLAADHLAMIQMLADNHVIDRGTPPATARADRLPDALVERAQQELRRNFRQA
ncbi:MAG TPA: HDOD domain-containing protein [Dyella sp.]|uniref:HDOD domain-containing protein n=1 Tax=Dyella sp. TaxID=1869338 RepID=UPI002BCBF55A|nr:HDOD domain-containing protein [Dyella sp.]HTV83868.1 HDOD domain-containing protein [Dyella sp.]